MKKEPKKELLKKDDEIKTLKGQAKQAKRLRTNVRGGWGGINFN